MIAIFTTGSIIKIIHLQKDKYEEIICGTLFKSHAKTYKNI
jgi:hypothetical protein